MKTTRRTPRRPAEPVGISAESTSISPLLPENQLTPALYRNAFLASDKRAVCARARALLGENDFMATLHHVRTFYFADGLRYAGSAVAAKNAAKVAKWADHTGFWPVAARLAMDTWREFLLCDNAVAFWMESQWGQQGDPPGENPAGFPKVAVLDCEAVDYQNQLGLEVLRIKFARASAETVERIRAARFDERWIKAHQTGGWLTVDPEKGECFAVLTWEKLGNGLGMPRLRSVLEKLSTRDLLSTADWLGAWESRNITELWKVGHEVRHGKDAGTARFHITTPKQKAIEGALKNKVGGRRVVANFDVAPSYSYLPADFFNPAKFASVMAHLETWGGAAVQMAKVGVATPGLLNAFAAEGRMCRDMVAGFLAGIFNDPAFFGGTPPPVRIEVAWNPDSFADPKMLLEKLRLAQGGGAMSTQTMRESLALDHDREGDRLADEKKKPERVTPTFEKAQGMSANRPNGRPSADAPAVSD